VRFISRKTRPSLARRRANAVSTASPADGHEHHVANLAADEDLVERDAIFFGDGN
jgi:hypothetical protein